MEEMEIVTHSSSSSTPEEKQPDSTHTPKGGWRAIKYILSNESFEKLASMSLIANITVYLRQEYNMTGIFLVNVVTLWSGTSNIASIGGAILSDACIGRFSTLLWGSIASLLGMGAMTMTAAIPQLRPPKCHEEQLDCVQAEKWQLGFLFMALGLLSVGAGGLRPCGIAFGADQFDTSTPKGRKQLESFFNWWYLSFTIALLISLTIVVYIQTNISWIIGFAIPTGCFFFSIVIFLVGRDTYVCKQPQGSVFSDVAKVTVAALRKRKVKLDYSDSEQRPTFYELPRNTEDTDKTDTTLMKQTMRFKCIDKAAVIVDPSELNDQGLPKSEWRLCNVQQVEQLKCILGILPVWISGIGCMLVQDQQGTFGILQAIQMDRSVGHFVIPPGWMGEASMIALSLWILMYEKVYIPKLKKITKKDSRLTMEQRIRTGIILSIFCMLVAGTVERKRRHSALEMGTFVSPVSIAMLLPQFVLSGLVEALDNVAMMEFFTTQMPEHMRTVAGSIFFITLSVSSYFNTFLVNIVRGLSGQEGRRTPWVGNHDLNMDRLEYYYYIVAGLGTLNLIYFTFFGRKYVRPGMAVSDHEEDLSLKNSVPDQKQSDPSSSGHEKNDQENEIHMV